MVYPKCIYFCGNETPMKVLSLKLDDDVFEETERLVAKLELARNRYINEALALYNKYNRRKLIKSQLAREASMAAKSPMEILKEFEALDDDQAV
jgi:predicted transcriptional regulator